MARRASLPILHSPPKTTVPHYQYLITLTPECGDSKPHCPALLVGHHSPDDYFTRVTSLLACVCGYWLSSIFVKGRPPLFLKVSLNNGLWRIGAISHPFLKNLLINGLRRIGVISTPLLTALIRPSHWHRWAKSFLLCCTLIISFLLPLMLNTLNNKTFYSDHTFTSIHHCFYTHTPDISFPMYL